MNDSLDVAKCEENVLFLNIAQAFLLSAARLERLLLLATPWWRGMLPGRQLAAAGVVSQVSTCINCLAQTFG
jgi:hypothetical protein